MIINKPDKEYFSPAERLLEEGRFLEAAKSFKESGNYVQSAFSMLLSRDLDEAEKLVRLSEDSLAKDWVLFLISLFKNPKEIKELPGFLSFRLFFEGTVTYFLKFELEDFFNRVLEILPSLERSYPEMRKFIGAAYLSLGNYDEAYKFLEEATRVCPMDVDINFKLGELYFFKKEYSKALSNFKKVLLQLPGHISSKKYIEKIENPKNWE